MAKRIIKSDRSDKDEQTEIFDFEKSPSLQGVYHGIHKGKGHKISTDGKFYFVPEEISETINEALAEVEPDVRAVLIERIGYDTEDKMCFEVSQID